MKKGLQTIAALAVLSLAAAETHAIYLDVTTWDGEGVLNEDGEVEVPSVNHQSWDMEALLIDSSTGNLVMIGGYNFNTGTGASNPDGSGSATYKPGDLFVDTDGTWGRGPLSPSQYELNSSNYNFEYVFDLDFSAGTVALRALTFQSLLENVTFGVNNNANPWRYYQENGGGMATDLLLGTGTITSDGIAYSDGDISTAYGISVGGGSHYVATIPLGVLSISGANLHFTMRCGNDDIRGTYGGFDAPDGGMTLSLLGLGIGALAFASRRK